MSAIATVVGSTDFTSNRDRLTLLDLLGGLTPLDVEGEQSLLQGLVDPGDTIILVCPIDSAAPKGRLILPQVQTIREILDHKGLALVCQTEELPTMLNKLSQKPKLVITDSQAFEAVNALTPADIPLTSFSILMARFKGKLQDLVTGVKALNNLNQVRVCSSVRAARIVANAMILEPLKFRCGSKRRGIRIYNLNLPVVARSLRM